MKTIIAGSRSITNRFDIEEAVRECNWTISEVVSGCAKGADQLGELWASHNMVPVKRFPADWDTHGKAAGPIRNIQMAEYADALIAIWDGESRGTKHMIDCAVKRNMLVYVKRRNAPSSP